MQDKKLQTKLVRAGTKRSNYLETSEALYLNSGFTYDNAETCEARFDGSQPGFVYSRFGNPSLRMLEEKLIAIEDGAEDCCVVSSGMAAVHAAIMSQIKTGEHLIASRVLFGSCHYIVTQILPRMGVEITLVDGTNLDEWRDAIRPNTTHAFIETPANPNLEIIDIKSVADICKENGVFLIVDNIFATALYQQPLTLGADAVIYSTTKHMDGQGRTLGGAILGSAEYIQEIVVPYYRHTGPCMSPFNAWIVYNSLETFDLRVDRMTDNAEAVAEFLESHPKIERVYYPHLKSHPQYEIAKRQMRRGSNMIAFEVKGGKQPSFDFMNALEVVDISNNLGDAKSLITHPASTTHSNIEEDERQQIGITEGLLRLSVGLEAAEDIIADFKKALS